MSEPTKLPFQKGDSLEYKADNDQKPSMRIVIVNRKIEEIFVTNGHGFHLFLRISDVLDRIKDGRFLVVKS